MPRPSRSVPSLTRHKPTGQGRVRLNKHDYYLGAWPADQVEPPAAVKAAYDRHIAEWLASGRQPAIPGDPPASRSNAPSSGLTVAELIARYWAHVESYYRHPDGSPTSEVNDHRYSLRPLNHAYGTTPALDFGPLALKAVRELMVNGYDHPEHGAQPPLCRRTANMRVRRIVRLFKWAVAEELLPARSHQGLKAVEGLKKGRCAARESAPILPVEEALVEATLPHLLAPVAAMVRLQLFSGLRPGETCAVRPCDLDTSGDVWLYRPGHHKTAWRGKVRVVALGPRAQAVLLPLLPARCPLCGIEGRRAALAWRDTACGPCCDRADEEGRCGPWPPATVSQKASQAHLFSPREAIIALRERQRATRKSKVQPSQQDRKKKAPKRRPREHYDRGAYTHAVAAACKKAGLAHWHPNQLRHAFGTKARQVAGLEGAQTALGHSQANVTEIYAERDLTLARKVAKEIG